MDVVNAMQHDAGITVKELRVDGGATANNFLMQFQSDILNTKVIRPQVTETTALGAAYLAGLAVGFWKNMEEIQEQWQVDSIFTPVITDTDRAALSADWRRAIKSTQAWADYKE
jgi:glycerol kinase